MKIRLLVLMLIALSVSSFFSVLHIKDIWHSPLDIDNTGYRVELAYGQRFATVVDKLHHDGVVRHPSLLLIYGRWTGLDEQIKFGEYNIPKGATAEALLSQLVAGDVIQYQLTLAEGLTLIQALDKIQSSEQIVSNLSGINDDRIVTLVGPHVTPEGLFFPDSYLFERGTTDWQILQRAYKRMEEVLASEWSQRSDGLPYESPYEALIMASIIEKETGMADEREQIAGVFVRRLNKGMRLQTDPTVIFGLGVSFDGNLTRSHLRDESNLYNTYRHSGLPPGPIALPGRAAIYAALNPKEGEELFFVARGDGSHIFSTTLAEHQAAVKTYQINRIKNYQSRPGQ